MRLKDLTGQIFNKYKVLYRDEIRADKRTKWICECECGNIRSVEAYNLHTGHSKSCGCEDNKGNTSHGMYYDRLYRIWRHVKERCYSITCQAYKNYGARGIKMYYEWINNPVSFIEYLKGLENFNKEGYTLDRINNDGNYEPGNLRWATTTRQVRNSRKAKLNENKVNEIRNLHKQEVSIAELSRMYNVSDTTIKNVIHHRTWKENCD